jgi:hypothetical protein
MLIKEKDYLSFQFWPFYEVRENIPGGMDRIGEITHRGYIEKAFVITPKSFGAKDVQWYIAQAMEKVSLEFVVPQMETMSSINEKR